jgi:hypothetical protein
MRKKLEEDLKIITLRMGNVILSINLARPQFFGVAAFAGEPYPSACRSCLRKEKADGKNSPAATA